MPPASTARRQPACPAETRLLGGQTRQRGPSLKECSRGFVQVVSSRQYAQRAILKFATYTGANYMGGKWVPGTLTNQNTKK